MAPILLNDTHAALNPVSVDRVARPSSVEELRSLIRDAGSAPVSIGGGRHAMGAQQFGTGTLHIDTRALDRVLELDSERGLVTAEAGIQWPALIAGIRERNDRDSKHGAPAWGIRQKQTGASDMTLGGALGANVHGRGLAMRPLVDDVESFRLIDARGEMLRCSRADNPELFRHVIGGYGLFGVVADVTLRLGPRRKVRRVVDVIDTADVIERIHAERDAGALYGDFQFEIDHDSPSFMQRGIFSRYRPVPEHTPIAPDQRYFTEALWLDLLRLARTDKSEAFRRYAEFYTSTDGQVYHTDTHQLSTYVPGYHGRLGDLPADARGTEMITELYVPRPAFAAFMNNGAREIRELDARVTYGTVRLIERDSETALPWAREDFACVIFNVLTRHTEGGIERSRGVCRALIDLALHHGGSFYLTYHRWARPDQLRAAYPEIDGFLDAKRRHDPDGRFRSDWYGWLTETLRGDPAPSAAHRASSQAGSRDGYGPR